MDADSPQKKEAMLVLNSWCSKSKRICACCERSFEEIDKEINEGVFNSNGTRIVAMYADYVHPQFKSKKYRLCGPCIAEMNLN